MPMRALPALLAVTATATAACLSVMAGWQRRGLLAERVLWIAVGVVLVVAAHLLPALCRPHGWRVRALGAALWFRLHGGHLLRPCRLLPDGTEARR